MKNRGCELQFVEGLDDWKMTCNKTKTPFGLMLFSEFCCKRTILGPQAQAKSPKLCCHEVVPPTSLLHDSWTAYLPEGRHHETSEFSDKISSEKTIW